MASYVCLSSWPAYEGRDRVNRARARDEYTTRVGQLPREETLREHLMTSEADHIISMNLEWHQDCPEKARRPQCSSRRHRVTEKSVKLRSGEKRKLYIVDLCFINLPRECQWGLDGEVGLETEVDTLTCHYTLYIMIHVFMVQTNGPTQPHADRQVEQAPGAIEDRVTLRLVGIWK